MLTHKEVTGFDTVEESLAYEKGRQDEQTVIMKWITDWEFSTNSGLGYLLMKKFKQLKEKEDAKI